MLSNEDKHFIQEYITDVKEELQLKYNLDSLEVNKVVSDSVFIKLMASDPEYVVNHDTDYWVEKINRGRG